jgi:L-alanine-DL-glutamate epimerase-like enolase superfamily enzyme
MRITALETIPVSVPLDPGRMITSARGAHDTSPYLLLRVHTDEGLVGLGEVSCTPRWSGEDSVTAAHVIERHLAPALVGEDPCAVERLTRILEGALVGHHFTKAAVEMALWDLAGKAAGLPVYRLLGGPTRERVRTKFSISGRDPERVAAIASWALEQGFTAMKVKVANGTLAGDLERVATVRSVIGPNVKLGVDANGGWSRAAARVAVERLVEHDIAFVEQPLAPSDLVGMAELRARSPIVIMADDAVGTPEDALDVVRAEAADVLSLYVGMAGGIGPARRAAAIALAAGAGWTIGSNLELGIGLAAHAHFAVSTPGLADDIVPCDIISSFYYPELLLTEPLPIEAGWASPPAGPGLGVELDLDRVEHYREDR